MYVGLFECVLFDIFYGINILCDNVYICDYCYNLDAFVIRHPFGKQLIRKVQLMSLILYHCCSLFMENMCMRKP